MASFNLDESTGRWEWHESRNEWRLYDSEIQKLLNDAYNKQEEKNKFEFNDTDFEVEFKFMVQKNASTHFERHIRYCVKSTKSEYYAWQWQDEGKRWISYAPRNVQELEENYENDSDELDLKINDKLSFKIDFNKMKQINESTKTTRKIRRIKSDCVETLKPVKSENIDETSQASNDTTTRSLRKRKLNKSASNGSVYNDDEADEEHEEKPKAKLSRRGSGASSKKVKEESKENVKLVKAETIIEEEDVEIKNEKEEVVEVLVEPKKSQAKSTSRSRKAAVKKEESESEEEIVATKSVSIKEQTTIKTLKFTGRIPVDEAFLETAKEGYHVYIENGVAYDCMLNQTNLQFNNNKYYLIQLLEQDKSKKYYVWFRWGRVGKKGQTTLDSCGTNLEQAKDIFERKFFDKTKNEWSEKDDFEKVPGKYDLVQKDYAAENEDEEIEKHKKSVVDANKPVPKSKLDESVQKLIEFVCNIQEMEDILKEMKYDAKKAPLGKLSANQIKAGYTALKKLEKFIKEKDYGRDFINACNEFYTRIPHDFGMRVPEPIRTSAALREKLQLLEALGDIEVAIKALNQQSDIENPIDRHYEQLECIINVLDRESSTFKLIEEYLYKTHAPTHCTYKMKLLDIFEVEKKHEKENFKDLGNRMLLWHGSRNTNWAGILSTGLRIAPPEAPVTGYMFGKGCYFADCSSKSANYCYATKQKNVGLVSLFDVSLGEPNELINADNNADKLPANKHSTKGLGRSEPDRSQWKTLDDGCIVPVGDLKPTAVNSQGGYTLLYNEYVVYDTNQIKMKYLLKVEFEFV